MLGLLVSVGTGAVVIIPELIEQWRCFSGGEIPGLLWVAVGRQFHDLPSGLLPAIKGGIETLGDVGDAGSCQTLCTVLEALPGLFGIFIEIRQSSGGVLVVEGLVQQSHLGHQCLVEISVAIEDLADRRQVGGGYVVGIGYQVACSQNAEDTNDNQGKRRDGKRKCDFCAESELFKSSHLAPRDSTLLSYPKRSRGGRFVTFEDPGP